ncbi:MAG: response regulator [Lewinellaceae bacterium]|nr:response regulator [Saprospiraceae bacterium]MCB9331118.1 response regulator [Lewinellaceae bacterium]
MKATILVVDDQPMFERLIRNLFRNQIKNGLYTFVFALNGIEALDALEQNSAIDMILSDINMPEMDGLTFLAKVHERQPNLKVVMVSAYGDMANIRKAMNLGAYDFVPKPIEPEDLEATVKKTLNEMGLIRQAEQAKDLADQNEQLQKLDQLKSRFFTNISHEFRTPLTVITGMADQILEHESNWHKNEGLTIRRNSNILLDLVNQILDLRKLEAGKLELAPVQTDVITYLRVILDSFYYYAERKDIQLQFQSGISKLIMDFDPEKLLRILSNLLANAIKFTPEGGEIWVRVQHTAGRLSIVVEDTGIGIPAEYLPTIFEQYFQSPASNSRQAAAGGTVSTGIGLALVDQLTKLMGGTIIATSEEGRGTSFTLELPVHNSAQALDPDAISSDPVHVLAADADAPFIVQAQEAAGELLPRILIVEDNPDVAAFLSACLEDQYILLIARDGQEGIDLALTEVPDLIVSDVMMPNKDGFELCRTLKSDERSSHIPIVLLTARVDDESRLTGLELGADAYLAKPFSKKELFIQLKNLLQIRRDLQRRYSQPGALLPAPEPKFRYEDLFMDKIRQSVLNNIDDEDYGIPELCRDVRLSRSNLHLKLKALTGRSTSHFVRAIRLRKGHELLHTTDMTVSEIAFAIGFKDPSYFSRSYRDEFGQSPKLARE